MAVLSRRGSSIVYSRITLVILLYSLILCTNTMYITFLNQGIGIYSGLYHATAITHTFHVFLLLISIFTLKVNSFIYFDKEVYKIKLRSNLKTNLTVNNPNNSLITIWQQYNKIIEYPLIILFIIIGALLLISANDLVSLFISLELQSYGLYILCTLYRNNESSTKGGLTYFLLGGLSSCFILLGASLLYTNSGTTNLDSLYSMNNLSNILIYTNNDLLYWYNPFYINFSIVIIIVGFLFKISSAPFHFWSPDVYDAIPTLVTTFVAIIPKISLFTFVIELIHYTNNQYYSHFNFSIMSILLISCLLSLIVGTVGGLYQSRIKKLLAYSTISHVGFILLALSVNTIESNQAFFFYLMQYSIANLNVFLILMTIGFSLYNFYYVDNKYKHENFISQDKENSPIQLTSQLQNYFYVNQTISISLAITIFSFIGIPPLVGFFAKQMVLSSALNQGYTFIVIVAILTSVISAAYYLNIIKSIFFSKDNYNIQYWYRLTYSNISNQSNSDKNIINNLKYFKLFNNNISEYYSTVIALLTLIILLFIFFPDQWLNIANILALILFNT